MLYGLEVISSVDPALDRSALEAVQQWRYDPYVCNGVPVEVESTVQVNYSRSLGRSSRLLVSVRELQHKILPPVLSAIYIPISSRG